MQDKPNSKRHPKKDPRVLNDGKSISKYALKRRIQNVDNPLNSINNEPICPASTSLCQDAPLSDNASSDTDFTCAFCGRSIPLDGAGSQHRNHCPHCLHSLHLDNEPGDRSANCGGDMEPIAVWVRGRGEWALIHRCKSCGILHSNRILADDNPYLLLSLGAKPLANPPFPLHIIDENP